MDGRVRQGLARRAVLVLGRAGMDLYADPPGTTIPAAGRFVAHLGGSAANIAAGLSRLGLRAGLIGRVSDDAVGRFVLAQLDAYGIDRGHVALQGGQARTSLAVVETRPADTQSVIYRNGAADFGLTEADVAAVDWGAWGALVITGTALAAAPSHGATMAALAAARAAGVVTVMDIDHRPYSWPSDAAARAAVAAAAALCDIVVGNDEEFALLAGPGGDGQAAAQALVAAGAALAVYKMGAAGSVAFHAGGRVATGIYRTAALKPTGAGDAFMAGLLAALAAGCDLTAALHRGSAAAALVVARVGCAPASPTAAEIDALIAAHPDGPRG